tara:strand:- start:158 stop:301 length:144 start_codon:yes stop_codon:yes gene_type:complete
MMMTRKKLRKMKLFSETVCFVFVFVVEEENEDGGDDVGKRVDSSSSS